ncbi:MAG: hypothetical protein MJB14_23680 [Spirochaetes bacterium]|nr:hypothetical protein [Spirochaetota bacterium]
MKIIKTIVMFVSLFCLLLPTFAQDQGNHQGKKVLFLYYASEYKEEVMKILEKKLATLQISVEESSIKSDKEFKAADYDAVVLFSGIAAFTPYSKATKFIRKNNYANNIIYFCPAFVEDAIYGYLDSEKVDAVTAPSELKNAETTAQEIFDKVMQKF